MRTWCWNCFLLLFLVLCICAPASAQRKHMQLLAPNVGYVSQVNKLYWTTNAGRQWSDITPPISISEGSIIEDVSFRDTSDGWVLLSRWDDTAQELQFDVASTTNAGASWSVTSIDLSNVNIEHVDEIGPKGQIDFVDSLRGWVNFSMASSSNFADGLLLATEDGGRTWKRPQDEPGVRGSIHFVTANEGWLAGGPGGQHLYVTRDGSKSWQEAQLTSPPEVGLDASPAFALPIFQGNKHGFLPVTYKGPGGPNVTVVLFATDDDGLSWKPVRVLPNYVGFGPGIPVPSDVTDSVWLTAKASKNNMTLMTTALGGAAGSTASVSANVQTLSPPVSEISFANSTDGWVWAGPILATSDGGATWADISPVRRAGVIIK